MSAGTDPADFFLTNLRTEPTTSNNPAASCFRLDLAMSGVVIVGAGHAGGILADALRVQGYEGAITLVGDEAMLPYQRPPLSKGYLLGEVTAEQLFLKPTDYYALKDIRFIGGTAAKSLDRAAQAVELSNGDTLIYDHLVLATGARPRMLNVPGADLGGIHALRTLADVDAIREDVETATSCVVVGGGFIGLEIAAVLAKLGKQVRIIEAADRLMGRAVSIEVSDYFLNLHRKKGSKVMLSAGVTGFEGKSGHITNVVTSEGPVAADLAIIGIGVIPNDQLARDAGLTVERGVAVDRAAKTSDPLIYAIGDCCHLQHAMYDERVRLESVQNAVDQAKLVAASIVGKPADYGVVPWFWSDQFDVKLQIAGLSNPSHQRLKYHDADTGTLAVYHFENDGLRAVETVNRAGDHMGGRRLIAAPTPPSMADVESVDGYLKQLLKRK